MNTEDSDILFVRLLLFPYYIVEKYAVSDAATVSAVRQRHFVVNVYFDIKVTFATSRILLS